MNRSLEGQVVWVTGASSGIGAALAVAVHADGASVILSARDTVKLERVAARCTGGHGAVHVVPLDLEDSQRLPGIARRVWNEHGPVDAVVHGSGLASRDLAERTDLSVDRRVFEVNFFGPINLTKALLPLMLARGHGHILVISSLAGKYGVPRASAYAASKHALHGWFESLRAETHERGLRITLAVPGFVATDIARHALTGDGSPFGRQLEVHARGMSPHACARALVEALRARPDETCVGFDAWASVLAARLAPRWWRWAMRNHPVRAWRHVLAALGWPSSTRTSVRTGARRG